MTVALSMDGEGIGTYVSVATCGSMYNVRNLMFLLKNCGTGLQALVLGVSIYVWGWDWLGIVQVGIGSLKDGRISRFGLYIWFSCQLWKTFVVEHEFM